MSIYDSIGGAPAVQATVDEFYRRVLADPTLAPIFADSDIQRLKAHQRSFIAAAVGGPEIFAGRDLGAAHAGLEISDADFDAVVAHLVDTLTSLGVSDSAIGEIGAKLLPLRSTIVNAPTVTHLRHVRT
ncbi:hemoglobin [Jatrophihabitans sp. GAS493]|uniref:group I truncated hemoglobin n=1 Tax=Jatrophihabitans sp. GAS493 TaxID=1907575 RepID=UPI000BB6B2E8|nr:group 1 truncated hemoglobin [Jatrophihabitans sp. GAS493]SOD70856.1 hemoglobin [Jatrophihabitans sp. GAS493]